VGLIMIMPKLHKIGLAVMLLGIIVAIASVITRHNAGDPFYFDILVFCMVALPAIIVTFVAWRWPIYGAFAGGVLSIMALFYLLLRVINPSIEPTTDSFYIAITLCFVAGSALILMATGVIPLAKRKKRKRIVS
jgi:peptidoglycan/LPS O-acetylase OafA/YrhL